MNICWTFLDPKFRHKKIAHQINRIIAIRSKYSMWKCKADDSTKATMYGMRFLVLLFLNFIVEIAGLSDGKPQVLEIAVPKNLKEGDEIRLTCDIKQGRFPIDFEWFLNNKKLESSSDLLIKNRDDESRLIIRSLSIEHIGDIRCVAINELGRDSQTANLFFTG